MESLKQFCIAAAPCAMLAMSSLTAQTCSIGGPVEAWMEFATGGAELSKVGLRICTQTCVPKYYTVRENNYDRRKVTVTPSYLSLPCNYNLPGTTTTESEIYTETIILDKFINTLGFQREGCLVDSPLQTSLANGGGLVSYIGVPSCTSTASPGGPWSDPGCYSSVYNSLHPLNGPNPTGTVSVDTCTKLLTRYILPQTSHTTGCILFTTSWEYEEGTSWSNEFTTGELKSVLDSRAAARVPSGFSIGPAITYRKLNNTEDCAEAADTRFRIRISDYVPKEWYKIKWHVVKLHWNWSWEHYVIEVKQRAPTSGDFFFPDASGRLINKPGWPPGACTQGGGEYTVYFNPTVTAIRG